MSEVACPSEQELSLLASGLLPEPPAEAVAAHVAACPACSSLLGRLPEQDALAVSLMNFAQRDVTASPLTGPQKAVDDGDTLQQLRLRLAAIPERLSTASGAQDRTLTGDAASRFERELKRLLEPAQSPDEIGRLGQYRVLKLLGRGGMGLVLLAEDPTLRRQVALKLILSHLADDPGIATRFEREARATAAVRSDHVVSIFAVSRIPTSAGSIPCMVMEYLPGESLESRLKREPLPLNECLHLGAQMATGLAAVHASGLVHRDVKPGNLWLEPVAGPDGQMTRAKLLDFGLAHLGQELSMLTEFGTVLGTPAYMSPEQASGSDVDQRSDLFSLGAVLYEMATGQRPVRGPTTMAVLMSLANETPASPATIDDRIPEPVSQFIMWLLAKDRALRPESAKFVADRLRQFASDLQPETGSRTAPGGDQASARATANPRTTAADTPTMLVARASMASPPKPRSLRRVLWSLCAIGLTGLAAWAAVLMIRMTTPEGTLLIESEDESVEVRITQNGATIIDHTLDRSISLKPGKYGIALVNPVDGLTLSAETITIERDGRAPIRITRERGITSSPTESAAAATVMPTSAPPPEAVQAAGKPADNEPLPSLPDHPSKIGLDPNAISESEMFSWQPKELIGVIGSHSLTHWQPVAGVAVSGDGAAILSTASDGLWFKAGHDSPARYFLASENPAISVVWHDAFEFLSVHRDGTVKRWQTGQQTDGVKLWTLPADTRMIRLSDDAKTLVAWVVPGTTWYDVYKLPHPEGEAVLFDVSGEELAERGRIPQTGPPALTPSGRWLTSHNTEAKHLERRDLTQPGLPVVSRQSFESPVRYVETPREDRAATQTVGQKLQWWECGEQQFRELDNRTLTGTSGDYTGLSISGDGTRIALIRFGSNDFEVCDITDERFGPPLLTNVPCNAGLHTGVISRDGSTLVGGSDMGGLRYGRIEGNKVILDSHPGYELLSERYTKGSSGPNLMSSEDGSVIGLVHSAPRGELWTLQAERLKKLAPPVGDDPYQRPISALSDDGTLAMVPGHRQERDLWRISTDVLSATGLPDQLQPMRAGFSDDQRLLAATVQSELVVYDVSTRLVERTAKSASLGDEFTVWSVALQRGTSRVVAISHPRYQRRELTLRVLDLDGNQFRERFTKDLSNVAVALSRHGHHLAVAYPDGVVEVYRVGPDSLLKLSEIRLPAPPVALDVSPSGDLLLTSDAEYRVCVWGTSDGSRMQQWQFPGRVPEAIFIGSTGCVLTANANQTAYILRAVNP